MFSKECGRQNRHSVTCHGNIIYKLFVYPDDCYLSLLRLLCQNCKCFIMFLTLLWHLFSKLFFNCSLLSAFLNYGRLQRMGLLKRKLATCVSEMHNWFYVRRVFATEQFLCWRKYLHRTPREPDTVQVWTAVLMSYSTCSYDTAGIVVLNIVCLGQNVIDEAMYVKIGLFFGPIRSSNVS